MTRPLPAGVAPGAGLTSTHQSVVHAVVGIIRRPRSTFMSVASRPRWGIVLLLFGAAAINYIDRQTLSVLKPMVKTPTPTT